MIEGSLNSKSGQFERRLDAAISSGWWMVLGMLALTTFYYLIYQWMMSAKPQWMLSLWGPDISWVVAQNITLWALVALKVIFWIILLAVVWLTLWRRKLGE